MKCALRDKIDHSQTKEIYRTTFCPCLLFEKKIGSMTELGVVDGFCCVKIGYLREKVSDLILRTVVINEDLVHNPSMIIGLLPDNLKDFARVLPEATGKNWQEIFSICEKRCNKETFDQPTIAAAPMEMTATRKSRC